MVELQRQTSLSSTCFLISVLMSRSVLVVPSAAMESWSSSSCLQPSKLLTQSTSPGHQLHYTTLRSSTSGLNWRCYTSFPHFKKSLPHSTALSYIHTRSMSMIWLQPNSSLVLLHVYTCISHILPTTHYMIWLDDRIKWNKWFFCHSLLAWLNALCTISYTHTHMHTHTHTRYF